jgi:YfiH family protein
MSEFYWTAEPWGRALRSASLLQLAPHFFTTRDLPLGVQGTNAPAMMAQIARAIGVDPSRVARLRQIHSNLVIEVDAPGRDAWGDARVDGDALVTADSRVALSVRVADCVPTLLADPGGRVGAAHGGWRGTAQSVVSRAIRALERLGARPRDIVAAVGPSIGPCCYEVGEEVRDAFRAAGHPEAAIARWFIEEGAALRLDLWTATADQLMAAGVFCHNVHVARLCTVCHLDSFFSFRVEGSATGRIEAIIRGN